MNDPASGGSPESRKFALKRPSVRAPGDAGHVSLTCKSVGGVMRFVSLFSCLAAAPLLMGAAQPVSLQPSSPWNVDYSENSCRLSRAFGEGDRKIILSLESEAPGQTDMFVLGKTLTSYSDEVSGRFLPVQAKPMKGHTAQSPFGTAVLWSRVRLLTDEIVEMNERRDEERRRDPSVRPPPIELAEKAEADAQRLEFAANVTQLEIGTGRRRPMILETGSLGAAIKAFDQCSRDSLRDWGVDPDVEDKIVRRAWSPDVYKWFTSRDYPPTMVSRGEQADVKVRLLVDTAGRVTKCTSLSHFKEKSFNEVVCDKFTKRARFVPAELADGTKVPSYYVNHVIFRMP